MPPPNPKAHNRYITTDNIPIPCRCNGNGRGFGGFTTCWYGYHASIADLYGQIEKIESYLAEIEGLDHANSRP